MMREYDISDAIDFLDEDFIRHTEVLRRKYVGETRENRRRRERLLSGAVAAACVLLLGILVALMVAALNRGLWTGREEDSTGLAAENSGEAGTDDMTTSNSEANVFEASEGFVAIGTLLAQLEQEEKAAFTESGAMDTILSEVDLGAYVGLYEVIYPIQTEGGILSESMGGMVTGSASSAESTGTELADGYYRVAGHEDLQYLIYKETHAVYAGEGTYAYTEDGELMEADYYFLMKFVCFDSEEYAYRDVLSLVYQIDSAEDIAQILVKPSKADNTDAGKALQDEIGESTVTDEDDIEVFYNILSSITCYGSDRWDLIDLGDWDVPADSSVDDNAYTHSRVWVERYLTITTDYGNEIDGLKYTAYSDMFYEYNGIVYSALTAEQAERICEILGIEVDGTVSSSISDEEAE